MLCRSHTQRKEGKKGKFQFSTKQVEKLLVIFWKYYSPEDKKERNGQILWVVLICTCEGHLSWMGRRTFVGPATRNLSHTWTISVSVGKPNIGQRRHGSLSVQGLGLRPEMPWTFLNLNCFPRLLTRNYRIGDWMDNWGDNKRNHCQHLFPSVRRNTTT